MNTTKAFDKLTEEEIKQLENYLIYFKPDNKPLTFARLHGFMCATITGPTELNIQKVGLWLIHENTLTSKDALYWILETMARFMFEILRALQAKQTIAPLLTTTQSHWLNDPIKTDSLITDWCFGYTEAVIMDQPNWFNEHFCNSNIVASLLEPAYLAAGYFDNIKLAIEQKPNPPTRQQIREYCIKTLPSMITNVYQHWRKVAIEHRSKFPETYKHVIKNDPCPCGSYQPFKKCCGEKKTLH